VAGTADVLRRRRLAGLELCELRRPPNLHLPSHSHADATVSIVLRGEGAETMAGTEYLCRWPTVLYRPPGVPHENRYGSSGARTFVIVVPPAAAPQGLPGRPLAGSGLLTALAVVCYRAFRSEDPLLSIAAEELLLRLVEQEPPASVPGAAPRWLATVEDRLRADMPPPTLAELGALAGVHPVYLARAFRRHRGCSIGEFLRRQRLDVACRHLMTGDVPLSELSVLAGFCDQSHLTRRLKGATGVSPARLRRLRRAIR
jgi:AraC family transcriptional regulator